MVRQEQSERIETYARKTSRIFRWLKVSIGLLLILSFFLPWAAQTEGCADDAAIIRDNISGYSLAVERIAPAVSLAPLSGLVIGALAFFLVGTIRPFARSIVSLGEVLPALYAWVYVNFEVFFLSPYVERFGYVITFILMAAVPPLSFIESVIHLPLMDRKKRLITSIIIAMAIAFFLVMSAYDALS